MESALFGIAAVLLLSHHLSEQSGYDGLSWIHAAQLLLLFSYTENIRHIGH